MEYKINHSMMDSGDWYDCLDRLYELYTGESFDYELEHNRGVMLLYEMMMRLRTQEKVYMLEQTLKEFGEYWVEFDEDLDNYLDENGELLPEYEDDYRVASAYKNDGFYDFIEDVTGIAED